MPTPAKMPEKATLSKSVLETPLKMKLSAPLTPSAPAIGEFRAHKRFQSYVIPGSISRQRSQQSSRRGTEKKPDANNGVQLKRLTFPEIAAGIRAIPKTQTASAEYLGAHF